MTDISKMTPQSGRMVQNDGSVVNIADTLGGETVTDEKYDIEKYMPKSGRMIAEDGSTVNIADILGGTATGETADIEKYMPMTGRFIKEDGTVVNIAKSITAGGGGGGTPQPPTPQPPTPAGKTVKDVNFYDYDGTLIESYTAEEVKVLSSLPTPPNHTGLVFQEWNYSLQQIKENFDACDIGAIYTTDDGANRFKFELLEPERLTLTFNFKQTKARGFEIDWGDGTTPQRSNYNTGTVCITMSHTYAKTGVYIVRIIVDADCEIALGYNPIRPFIELGGSGIDSNYYYSTLKEINFGSGIATLEQRAIYRMNDLSKISFSSFLKTIATLNINQCKSLKFVCLPKNITAINGGFSYCDNLTGFSLPVINNITGDFSSCQNLGRAVLIGTTTTPALPSNLFQNDYDLKDVFIKIVGATTLKINTFVDCKNLTNVVMPYVKTLEGMTFQRTALKNYKLEVDSISYNTFFRCENLKRVQIGANITDIPSNTFAECYQLLSAVFLGDVKNIQGTVFNKCYSLKTVDLTKCTTVPTLASTNAFQNTPADMEILVPSALLTQWQAATNWTTYKDKIKGV